MTPLDVSTYAGLCAMGLLTVNILLGLLLSARYNPVVHWPHRRLPIFDVHNWTAYAALSLIILHPVALLFTDAGFRVIDVLWPVHSPKQTLYNCLGAAAFYLTVFVVATSFFRAMFGSRLWKKLHYTSYAAAAFLFVHSILIDPNLKQLPPDYFDAEKVLVEGSALLIVVATIWRIRYQPRKSAMPAAVRKAEYEAV